MLDTIADSLYNEHMTGDLSSLPKVVLAWRVHLLRQRPERARRLVLVLVVGGACVWLMFRAWLPVLAALGLLLGSASEYLFPISYALTDEAVYAYGPLSRATLAWRDARRCLADPSTLTLTPLAIPSRLDAFRGVTLRFASPGHPGDRESVLREIARLAPHLKTGRSEDEKTEENAAVSERQNSEEPTSNTGGIHDPKARSQN